MLRSQMYLTTFPFKTFIPVLRKPQKGEGILFLRTKENVPTKHSVLTKPKKQPALQLSEPLLHSKGRGNFSDKRLTYSRGLHLHLQ